MFSLPSYLPAQWEKKIVRYILNHFDFLEERTLGDLSNLDGSLGRNSVLTVKDVGIKIDRLKQMLKIPLPPRLLLTHAIIGTLTIRLPTNFLLSGSIEVLVSDVRLSATIAPAKPPSPSPSPGSRQQSTGNSDNDSEDGEPHGELPTTAEDLAQSFLQSQPKQEQDQLLHSLYQDRDPLSASSHTTTSSTTSLDDDEGELGVGTSVGLPKILADLFKGIGDRLKVKIRGVVISLETTAPVDGGGEKIVVGLEVEDVDVEGVTTDSITPTGELDRRHKEGKRCIALDNIRAYITSDASLFEPPTPVATSTVFGEESEALTEKVVASRDMAASRDTVAQDDGFHSMESSTNTVRDQPPLPSSPLAEAPNSVEPDSKLHVANRGEDEGVHVDGNLDGSLLSGSDRFADFEDSSSDEEVLAFAPSAFSSSSRMHASSGSFLRPPAYYDDDEDSEDEGGATFAPSMFPEPTSPVHACSPPTSVRTRSPSASFHTRPVSAQTHSYLPSTPFYIRPISSSRLINPLSPSGPISPTSPVVESLPSPTQPSDPDTGEMEDSESSDEMDAEASRMLSESTLFTHSEAGSLYLSVTSGVFGDPGRRDDDERLKDQVGEEEVDFEEMDARLDALLGTGVAASPKREIFPGIVEEPVKNEESLRAVERRIKKKIFSLDRIEVFVPSLSAGKRSTAFVPRADPAVAGRGDTDSSYYPHVPGAFSMYASRRNFKSPPPPISPPQLRRQTMVKIVDVKSTPSVPDLVQEKPEIEIGLGKVEAAVDFTTARILGMVMEAVTGALSEEPEDGKGKCKGNDNKSNLKVGAGPSSEILVAEVALKLVGQLAGVYVRNEGEGGVEEVVHNEHNNTVVECLLREMKITHGNFAQNVTTSTIDVKRFTLRDGKEDILSFIPPTPIKSSRKRGSHASSVPATHSENDITFVISQNPLKGVNVTTLPVKLHFDLKRLEETLGAFGGVGGVLASTSTTASTVTITKARSPDTLRKWGANEADHLEPEPSDVKVNCQIGGLMVGIIGSTGNVAVETSPLKIRSENGGVVITLDKIEVYGPDLSCDNGRQQAATSVMVENTRVEFLNKPEQEDLTRLLELLTPSKDQLVEEDGDILIDTLLRQRQQGSMLRIGVGAIKVTVEDLSAIERLQQVGDDVVKVLTATDFVTQEERPGLLTLLHIDSFHGKVDVGGGIGTIEADMGDFGVAHVPLPSLVALAVEKVKVRRNGVEELLGEALEGKMLDKSDEGKPMLMIRVVGDEPEPVVKLKLWNIRIEYRVETLMSLMDSSTTEELVAEMTHSVINIAEKNSRDEDRPPLGIDVVVRDCILGVNPLGLKSRGLVVLSESRINAALPSRGMLGVGVQINKAFFMLIDDTANLHLPDRQDPRRRKLKVTRQVDGLASLGYVSIITISSAQVMLQVVDVGPNGEKAIDVELRDDLLFIESCADSTQTLLGIVNGVKPPVPEGEGIKYLTEIVPLDVFKSMTEDAFAPPSRQKPVPENAAFHPDDEDDGDLVYDDVPMNLSFVESYYGHQPTAPTDLRESEYTKDELADSMLDEDLGSIAPGPCKPPGVGEKGMLSSFTGQVKVLEESMLDIQDDHFGKAKRPFSSAGPKKINTEVVNKWDSTRNEYIPSAHPCFGKASYFPLRIKVRDVHLIWNLHDGYDWPGTRDAISQAVKKVEVKASERRSNRKVAFDVDDEEESLIGDVLFNSIYIGIPVNRDPKELSKAIFDDHLSETSSASSTVNDYSSRPSSRSGNAGFSGGRNKNHKLSRSKTHKLQIELKGVCADVLLFPPDAGETQSSVDIRVKDFEIFDHVPTSTWKKFVTYMQDNGERETGSNMLHLEIMNVKPVQHLAAREIVLRVTILPLRLHVDQDTLDFMTRFFEFKDNTAVPPGAPTDEPFIQRVEVNSVRVKLDYKPKKVDYAGLRSGRTTEFMNFFILEEADMVLRHCILYGITGFPKMSKMLNDTWMPDVQKTQLGDVLAGVAPVRSLVNLAGGMKDLVAVPMREYKKDGRIVRSVQKGVVSFAKTTTGELVRLGAKLAVGTQNVLQDAEDFLVPAPEYQQHYHHYNETGSDHIGSMSDSDDDIVPASNGSGGGTGEGKKAISLYADQPMGVVQGLRDASDSLKRNFGNARDAIMAVPVDIAEGGSAQGAAKAVVRAAPVAIIRPMIGATEAVSRTLLGVTNSLDPEQKRRVDDKYKKH